MRIIGFIFGIVFGFFAGTFLGHKFFQWALENIRNWMGGLI